MNLMTMKYKDFTWPVNPVKLEVKQQKNVKEMIIPFSVAYSKSIGMSNKKVSGKGYFTGEKAWENYLELKEVFEKEGVGSLHLPGYNPFNAIMENLVFVGEPGANLIEYSFSFIECKDGFNKGIKADVFAKEGDSLWDYAYNYKIEMDELVAANPHIRDIASLKEGERVVFP